MSRLKESDKYKCRDEGRIYNRARFESLDRFRRESEKKRLEDKSKNLRLCLSNEDWDEMFGVEKD